MKANKVISFAAVTLSSAGLMLPRVNAAVPAVDAPTQTSSGVSAVSDVSLGDNGVLTGQVVDGQGQAVADAPVSVLYDGKEVAKTRSDTQGVFAVSGLHGGAHVVVSGENGGMYRVWTTDSAPPSAGKGVMIVRGGQVARGQSYFSRPYLLMMGAMTGIVVGGVVSQQNSSGS